MKKGIFKIIGIIAVLCLALVFMAGCGSNGPSSPSTGGTPTPTVTPTPTPENLLTNGGFEQGDLTGWQDNSIDGTSDQVVSASTVTIGTSPNSGTYSLYCTGRGADTWRSVQQDITDILKTNGTGTYYVECWVKFASSTVSDNGYIDWDYQSTGDNNGNMVYGAGSVPSPHVSFSSTWTKISGTINMTWTGTLESSIISFHTDSSTADLYIDDFVMYKVN
jgi:Carbohydrate binding domain.